METFKQLKPHFTLQKVTTKIHTYGENSFLPVCGKFTATVETETKYAIAIFYVVHGSGGCQLSYDTASNLGLIQLLVNTVNRDLNTTMVGNGLPMNTSVLIHEFEDVFQGIGKLKDCKVSTNVNNKFPPVAQPARRIPFHIRKSLSSQLKDLEQQGIIERVPENTSTPWVSPLVVFPKQKNPEELRICVDMRKVNQVVERVRHPSPTVEEIIEKLNGAAVFSKLDLTSGYHQLELDENSRYLTTFATHEGLFRYTRLIFGLSASSEIFLYEIQKCLENITGALNISDDILVFGHDQQSHDLALRKVLEMLKIKNLRANLSKCQFNKKNLDFFGYHFSADGVSASKEKITAVHSMMTPSTVSEV